MNADYDFLRYLCELGRAAAAIWLDDNWNDLGTRSSIDVFDRFLCELPRHLNEQGQALLVLSSDNEVEEALKAAEHLHVNVLKRCDLINEIVTVYELKVRTWLLDLRPTAKFQHPLER